MGNITIMPVIFPRYHAKFPVKASVDLFSGEFSS